MSGARAAVDGAIVPALRFVVMGKPTAYVRMTRRSQHEPRAIAYTAYREQVGWTARQAGAVMRAGPVSLSVHAMVTARRWDLDNLVKGISDALNGVCWQDDKQVTHIHAYLELGWLMDRVEVTVTGGRAMGESRPRAAVKGEQ